MKFNCKTNVFREQLNIVKDVVKTNSIHSILKTFLVKARKGELEITGSNLYLTVKTRFECDVIESGNFCINAKQIEQIIEKIDDEDISFENTIENNEYLIQIQSTSGKFTLNCLPEEEYPQPKRVNNSDSQKFSLPLMSLIDGLKYVLFAASKDENSDILTGINLEKKDDTLYLSSTDGRRLARTEIKLENTSCISDFQLTVRERGLKELLKASSLNIDKIDIEMNDSFVVFRVANREILISSLTGNYPQIERLIPRQFKHNVNVNREQLLCTLDLVSTLASNDHQSVDIKIDHDSQVMYVGVIATDRGQTEQIVPIESNHSGISSLSFNLKYFKESVKNCYHDFDLKINSNEEPVVLKPTIPNYDVVQLLMPVRINK